MAKTISRAGLRPKLIFLAVASCFSASAALANPTGANVVHGTAAIHQAGNLLQITNSPNAIINWQSFSIGASEITRFIQQSPASAVLNRVTTQNPSSILGALQSNGRVFLINPNGILIGAGAQIDVAGLVASTLALSDQDFLAGRLRFTDGLGKSVVNDGSIATGAGGSVYLIGSGVTNNGIIRSPQGEVILAAGNSVELVSPGTPSLRVEVAASDHAALNLGQIISDAGRVGIYAGLINNSGTIRADSAVTEGGRIVLKASKSATLEDSSVLSTQGQGGGRIEVLAGDEVSVAGRLDASAPNGGDGGFIETSGKSFSIDSSAVITATAPFGKTGTWLIDPFDFTIAAQGGEITGSALSALLNNLNIVITSEDGVLPVPSGFPPKPGMGDIFVNDAVTWSSTNSLTLTAVRFVQVNKPLTGPNGGVFLNSGSGVMQSPEGAITANQLYANGGTGSVLLNAANNKVNMLAGDATGTFSFVNGQSLQVGALLNQQSGIQVPGASPASINVNVTSGDLMITSPISAMAPSFSSDVVGAPASVTLSAAGMITVANSGSVQAFGGAGSDTGGSGTIVMTANGMTFDNATVWAAGFVGGPLCDCITQIGGNGAVSLNALGGTINVMNGAVVEASGGAGIVADGAGQINLSFTGRSTGGYFINGVEGLITDGDLRVRTGFFVNAKPAILDQNLFVTYINNVTFVDNLVASMNQQIDVLADQLKAGETGSDEDEKEKLPFCSS